MIQRPAAIKGFKEKGGGTPPLLDGEQKAGIKKREKNQTVNHKDKGRCPSFIHHEHEYSSVASHIAAMLTP